MSAYYAEPEVFMEEGETPPSATRWRCTACGLLTWHHPEDSHHETGKAMDWCYRDELQRRPREGPPEREHVVYEPVEYVPGEAA